MRARASQQRLSNALGSSKRSSRSMVRRAHLDRRDHSLVLRFIEGCAPFKSCNAGNRSRFKRSNRWCGRFQLFQHYALFIMGTGPSLSFQSLKRFTPFKMFKSILRPVPMVPAIRFVPVVPTVRKVKPWAELAHFGNSRSVESFFAFVLGDPKKVSSIACLYPGS